ncbi:MAG: asparaginase, partial [Planctomycetota bacterium]|nr:asparaginase [Planctomycetota bacterium]
MSSIKVVSVRGEVVETEEEVFCAVYEGALRAFGDVEKEQHFRSAAKPLQALMLVQSGAAQRFGLESRHIAVAAASHTGTRLHAETVLDMLKRGGLDESFLDCGTHRPLDSGAQRELLKRSAEPTPLQHNCSGKHAAMLLVSKHLGYPLNNYRKPEHRLQVELRNLMALFCEMRPEEIKTASDGCGVLEFSAPLKKIALAYRNLVHPPKGWQKAAECVLESIKESPVHFCGETTLSTEVARITRGRVVVKGGAEGTYCGVERDKGFSFALKVRNGTHYLVERRQTPITSSCVAAVSIMRNFGFLSETEVKHLEEFLTPSIFN